MGLITTKKVEKILKDNLKSDEQILAFTYGLLNFKGHCLGLTDKKLVAIRISTFLSKVKEKWEVALENISDVHYEHGGATAIEGLLIIKTKDNKEYKFKITRTAGLSGGDNLKNAEKFYKLLINQ